MDEWELVRELKARFKLSTWTPHEEVLELTRGTLTRARVELKLALRALWRTVLRACR